MVILEEIGKTKWQVAMSPVCFLKFMTIWSFLTYIVLLFYPTYRCPYPALETLSKSHEEEQEMSLP